MSNRKTSSTALPELTRALLSTCLEPPSSSDIPLQALLKATRPAAPQINGMVLDKIEKGEISYKYHWRECKCYSTAWLTYTTAHRAPGDISDHKKEIIENEETRPEEDLNMESMTSTRNNGA